MSSNAPLPAPTEFDLRARLKQLARWYAAVQAVYAPIKSVYEKLHGAHIVRIGLLDFVLLMFKATGKFFVTLTLLWGGPIFGIGIWIILPVHWVLKILVDWLDIKAVARWVEKRRPFANRVFDNAMSIWFVIAIILSMILQFRENPLTDFIEFFFRSWLRIVVGGIVLVATYVWSYYLIKDWWNADDAKAQSAAGSNGPVPTNAAQNGG